MEPAPTFVNSLGDKIVDPPSLNEAFQQKSVKSGLEKEEMQSAPYIEKIKGNKAVT